MVTFDLPISVDLMDWLQKYIVHVHKVKKNYKINVHSQKQQHKKCN